MREQLLSVRFVHSTRSNESSSQLKELNELQIGRRIRADDPDPAENRRRRVLVIEFDYSMPRLAESHLRHECLVNIPCSDCGDLYQKAFPGLRISERPLHVHVNHITEPNFHHCRYSTLFSVCCITTSQSQLHPNILADLSKASSLPLNMLCLTVETHRTIPQLNSFQICSTI